MWWYHDVYKLAWEECPAHLRAEQDTTQSAAGNNPAETASVAMVDLQIVQDGMPNDDAIARSPPPDMDDTLLAEDGLAKDDAIARSPPPDMDDMLSKYFHRYGE